MIISVIGNIASGKTTLCNKLKLATGWPIYSIDDIRRKVNKACTIQLEELAWDILVDQLRLNENCILEMTGASQHYHRCLAANNQRSLTIKIEVDKKVLLKRIEKRSKSGYKLPPLPYTFPSVEKSIDIINLKMDLLNPDMIISNQLDEEDLLNSILYLST